MRKLSYRDFSLLLAAALAALAGCGGTGTATPTNSTFSITPGTGSLDTNCTGCNASNLHGAAVEQFSARFAGGISAPVRWSVTGGDPVSGPGSISATGQYSPPSYLTTDRVEVVVTATLASDHDESGLQASAVLSVTPGFLQPLTPENVALGANGQVTITGLVAENGGTTGIHFALADSATGSTGGLGTLSAAECRRALQSFTSCAVTYSAPALVSSTSVTFVVATVGASHSKTATQVLVNAGGVQSNPAYHQGQGAAEIALGSSGGNLNDYDAQGNQIVDCCSGTLGALLQDASGHQFLLSNNHVLAKSDQAHVGDAIVHPGLIDNNCTPTGTTPVATLRGWLPLSAPETNADAAIAQVVEHAVNPSGNILELGARLPDGTLAAASVGISSTGGKGEAATLTMKVAKSGRTTGLTCASVSALDLDVTVDYFLDCAETKPYLSKTFTHQLGIRGNAFSDAGDSGALVVDAANAEPVGLFFAGGRDAAGVSEGVANPASDLLTELGRQLGSSYSFVGGADHAVSCLSYGDSTVSSAQARDLSEAETARGKRALVEARRLVNPAVGILGVAAGKSSDHLGEAAILVYVEESADPTVPMTVAGVRTVVIPTSAQALAAASTPQTPAAVGSLTATALQQAVTVKQQVARRLLRRNSAIFGVGVGQSLDDPREPALVIYVDRKRPPTRIAPTINGLRTRSVVMDRLHVTRSYTAPTPFPGHCQGNRAKSEIYRDLRF